MREPTKQLGLRIPADQYNKLQDYAKSQKISLTELIISIFDEFLDKSTPGLCPSCHTQNNPDAKFCQKCSTPLTEEAAKKYLELKRLTLNPEFIREVFNKANIDHLDEDSESKIAINIIYQLQKEIDELKPVVEWAKSKMEEESKYPH